MIIRNIVVPYSHPAVLLSCHIPWLGKGTYHCYCSHVQRFPHHLLVLSCCQPRLWLIPVINLLHAAFSRLKLFCPRYVILILYYQNLSFQGSLSNGITCKFPPVPQVGRSLCFVFSGADINEAHSRIAHSRSLLALKRLSTTSTLEFFRCAAHQY